MACVLIRRRCLGRCPAGRGLAIGRLHGRLPGLADTDRHHAALAALLDDIVYSSAIAGEQLDMETVHAGLAAPLGVAIGGTF